MSSKRKGRLVGWLVLVALFVAVSGLGISGSSRSTSEVLTRVAVVIATVGALGGLVLLLWWIGGRVDVDAAYARGLGAVGLRARAGLDNGLLLVLVPLVPSVFLLVGGASPNPAMAFGLLLAIPFGVLLTLLKLRAAVVVTLLPTACLAIIAARRGLLPGMLLELGLGLLPVLLDRARLAISRTIQGRR